MTLDPEEKSWSKKHPVAITFIVLFIIIIAGSSLKVLQTIYFPSEAREFSTPILLNVSYLEFDELFSVNSNLTEQGKDELFDSDYKYNIVRWTCKPIGCQDILSKPTLKLVCNPYGYTEDVRVSMKEDCVDVENQPEVEIVFQLFSRTTGEYYFGRAGRIIGNE